MPKFRECSSHPPGNTSARTHTSECSVTGTWRSDTSCCHVTPPTLSLSLCPSGASWVREEALPDKESVTQQLRRSLACCDGGDVNKQKEEKALDYPAATTLNQLATVSSSVQHSAAGRETVRQDKARGFSHLRYRTANTKLKIMANIL